LFDDDTPSPRDVDPVLALLAEKDGLSQRAAELRAEADKIWRAMPAEMRQRRMRLTYGGGVLGI
jgi:hypothetical protein